MSRVKLSILHVDFFPHFSRRARRFIYSPLGVLVTAVLVSILCGLVIHPRVYVLAGGLLAVIVMGVAWPWLIMRVVSGEWRTTTPRMTEGETTMLSIAIRNPLFIPVPGLAIAVDNGTPVVVDRISARREIVCEWAWFSGQRGIYPRSLSLQSSFPFGLWTASKSIRISTPIIVWPRTLPVGAMPSDAHRETLDGLVARPRVGSAGDLLGVRPYRRGDSLRRIHWMQSARHDRLIVCELQSAARPRMMIAVDLDPTIHSTGPDGTAEWAIRIAASFASGWLAEGAMIGLALGNQIIMPASGDSQRLRILDALAAAEARPLTFKPRSDLLVIRITTDARVLSIADGYIVRIRSDGFGGLHHPLELKSWLVIDNAQSVPRQLRSGWSEARHG